MEEQERCSGAVPNPIDANELHGTTVIISVRPLTDTMPPKEAVWGRILMPVSLRPAEESETH